MTKDDLVKILSAVDLSVLKRFKRDLPYAVVLIALTFLFYRFGYQRNVNELSRLGGELKVSQSEVDRIQAEVSAAENMKRSVDQAALSLKKAEDKLKYLSARLPSNRRISKILYDISAADRNSVRVLSVKPLPVEDRGELIRLPFNVTLDGRYVSFGDYLERIENLQRVMIVDNFMIEAKDDGRDRLTIQMYLSAYALGAVAEGK